MAFIVLVDLEAGLERVPVHSPSLLVLCLVSDLGCCKASWKSPIGSSDHAVVFYHLTTEDLLNYWSLCASHFLQIPAFWLGFIS